MIKRVHIKGYKSLVDMEVSLQPLSVLFGPNAAGKSNFLDALQLLSRIATSRTLSDAFAPPYRGKPLESFTFGPDGVKGLLSQESVSFEIEVDVELSQATIDAVDRQVRETTSEATVRAARSIPMGQSLVSQRYLRYGVAIEMLPQTGAIRVSSEYLAAISPDGLLKTDIDLFLETKHDHLEGSDIFPSSLLRPRRASYSVMSSPINAELLPHLAAMREELASWQFYYFEPREHMRASTPVKEVYHVGLMGEELAAYLNTLRLTDEKQFRAVVSALRMIIPSVSDISVRVNDVGEVDLGIVQDGVLIPARVISEGTLRVLGLLTLAGAKYPPAVIGIEEPENGVHPGRLKLIAEFLRTRVETGRSQVIVTTHSALLPDMIPDEYLFVCSRKEGKTSITPLASWLPEGEDLWTENETKAEEEESVPVSQRLLRGDFDA